MQAALAGLKPANPGLLPSQLWAVTWPGQDGGGGSIVLEALSPVLHEHADLCPTVDSGWHRCSEMPIPDLYPSGRISA